MADKWAIVAGIAAVVAIAGGYGTAVWYIAGIEDHYTALESRVAKLESPVIELTKTEVSLEGRISQLEKEVQQVSPAIAQAIAPTCGEFAKQYINAENGQGHGSGAVLLPLMYKLGCVPASVLPPTK